jgi:hypothetical protein
LASDPFPQIFEGSLPFSTAFANFSPKFNVSLSLDKKVATFEHKQGVTPPTAIERIEFESFRTGQADLNFC